MTLILGKVLGLGLSIFPSLGLGEILACDTFAIVVVGIWHFCCCCWYWHLALLLLLLASGTFAGLILQVPGLWLEGIEEGAHLLTGPEIENKIRVWDIKELGIMDNKQKIMDEGK